jgi:hypothetical protein
MLNIDQNLYEEAAKRYAALYNKALPGTGSLDPSCLEIATFNRSKTFEEFQKIGLGLETIVIFSDGSGSGHTGKVLMNLPGQLLPEHCHTDTIVLRKQAVIADGFMKISELINGFKGIMQYNSDGSVKHDCDGNPKYLYHEMEYQIVQAKDGLSEYPSEKAMDIVEIFPGKSETFKSIYGDGVLFADTAEVIHAPSGVNPEIIPDELLGMVEKIREEQIITTTGMIYMAKGTSVLLAKNTKHAFLGGINGCVYLEFSTPSMDEADRFTDKQIIR